MRGICRLIITGLPLQRCADGRCPLAHTLGLVCPIAIQRHVPVWRLRSCSFRRSLPPAPSEVSGWCRRRCAYRVVRWHGVYCRSQQRTLRGLSGGRFGVPTPWLPFSRLVASLFLLVGRVCRGAWIGKSRPSESGRVFVLEPWIR